MILCSSLFAQSPHDSSSTIYGSEYFPFNEKIELIFDSNIGETKRVVEIDDKFYKVTNISDKFTYTQKFIKKNNGIYLIHTEQYIDIFLYSRKVNITYSDPVLQLPFPQKIGDVWSWSGYQVKNGDTTSISIIGNAIAEEILELQAGKFNTIKIKLFFEEKDGERTTLYQWLAPGLGAVKTKAIIEGNGIIQFAMSLLGYDEIDTELKEIRYLE